MVDKVIGWIRQITELGLAIIALGVVLQIIFGAAVPFLGLDIVGSVVALVKRGAMKVNYDYHESIEQSEQIKQALELQYKAQEALQKQMRELDISMQKLKELSKKEKMTLKEKLNLTELYKDLEEIPEFIKKKVG